MHTYVIQGGGGQYFWFPHYVKLAILLENGQNFGEGPTHC